MPLIRTWSNAAVNMVCWARCSRSRTNVWFIAPPARAGRCHTELYDRTPRRFKVIQGPKSNTHATSRGSSTTGNWNASAPPSAHSVKISDSERAGCRRLPRADLDEQRGRSRIVSDDRARGGTERDATPAGSVGDMAASGHTGAPVPGRSPRRTDRRRALAMRRRSPTRTEVARVHEKDTKRSKVESTTLNLHDSCFIM